VNPSSIRCDTKTLNFLTENGLLQYADLETKVAEVTAAFGDTNAALKTAVDSVS
jgi:hypothetical protein